MTLSAQGRHGLVTAPHALAAEVGAQALARGANAIEAAIVVSAALSVVYPHMTGLGGDAFWLISDGSMSSVRGLMAAGAAGSAYEAEVFRTRGLTQIPFRGALSVMTVPGMLRGWEAARSFSATHWSGGLAWGDLLAPAQELAARGFPLSANQERTLQQYRRDLTGDGDFCSQFLRQHSLPQAGEIFCQPALAQTLNRLIDDGPGGFYAGDLADEMLTSLQTKGSLLQRQDLENCLAEWVEPLQLPFAGGSLFNLPPPSQGIASLMIAGIMERLGLGDVDPLSAELIHGAVEATRRVFPVRDRVVQDPRQALAPSWHALLQEDFLDRQADEIRAGMVALLPPWQAALGDTTWFGVVDGEGRVASVIQSLYHEFGSGVVAGTSGVLWNNRGCAFSLEPNDPRTLVPGMRPFHTLNPALFGREGRIQMAYGSMGGDGQPQTQVALLFRHLLHGLDPAAAVDAPRWLLGRTWGNPVTALRLESRYGQGVRERLHRWGHSLQLVPGYSDLMGHAGLLRVQLDGSWIGASDPRSDGGVAGPASF
ncbi:gamma-glutamyltransferase family protein [Acidithiobacillus ferrooxidans]|uniref:gamma-glutamyltransferase family protein n=1 Tax=Acidithiobacillus ferrooxidans TaxID=920 RepID=UPI001D021872|nr:gamma-glutamyltransferase family protein [Acidithiobacillus ferrooxidans]MBU2774840.1 gamma-glutamyltransferase family protein [Acidithiobacillus ferrooxidans]